MSPVPTARLVEVLAQDERILVAYLFGSKSKGVQTSESDTDIAVLLSELPEDLLGYWLDLVEKLSRVLGDAVNLTVLNRAPPLLKHEVIKHGQVLCSRDEKTRVEFETKAEGKYLDFSLRRRQYDKAQSEEMSKWKR